jgi:hypothetical protein
MRSSKMIVQKTKRTAKLSFAERTAKLSFEQQELATNFYDVANDKPRATFEQVAKQVVPRGFGKSKTSAAFKKEARTMFDLAR